MNEKLTTSKALSILYNHEDLQGGHYDYWKAYRFIEKQLKALELIKEKPETFYLINCNNYETYFEIANDMTLIEKIYTKEEFNLLKEVFYEFQ